MKKLISFVTYLNNLLNVDLPGLAALMEVPNYSIGLFTSLQMLMIAPDHTL